MSELLDDIDYTPDKIPLSKWVKYTFWIGATFAGVTTIIMNTISAPKFRTMTNLPSNLVVGIFVIGAFYW